MQDSIRDCTLDLVFFVQSLLGPVNMHMGVSERQASIRDCTLNLVFYAVAPCWPVRMQISEIELQDSIRVCKCNPCLMRGNFRNQKKKGLQIKYVRNPCVV